MACVDHDGTRVGWDVTAAAWWGAAQHHAGVVGKLPLDSPFWDRLSVLSLSSVMGPGCCHEEGLWREFCDRVTVGDCWRGGLANLAGVVPWLGAGGF
jgi:hypothetical protein